MNTNQKLIGRCGQLFNGAIARVGKIDVLINNTGIMVNKLVAEMTEAEFDRMLATNVKGVFLCC